MTDMKPEVYERKWEIDSLCYPIRLAYHYWKVTGDASVFSDEWLQAVAYILQTFREQQRKEGNGPYHFQRKTERALDTVTNNGRGNPGEACRVDSLGFPSFRRCHHVSVSGAFQFLCRDFLA